MKEAYHSLYGPNKATQQTINHKLMDLCNVFPPSRREANYLLHLDQTTFIWQFHANAFELYHSKIHSELKAEMWSFQRIGPKKLKETDYIPISFLKSFKNAKQLQQLWKSEM